MFLFTRLFLYHECRGLCLQVNSNDRTVVYILIRGTASEQSKIDFQVYLYKTNFTIDHVVDGNFGTTDNPSWLNLVHVE